MFLKQIPYFVFYFFKVGVAQKRQYFHQTLGCKIPPAKLQQQFDQFVIKPLFQRFCGISSCDGVSRDILHYNGACSDDSSIPDMNTGHDDTFPTNPDIIADDGISLMRKLGKVRRGVCFPAPPNTLNG